MGKKWVWHTKKAHLKLVPVGDARERDRRVVERHALPVARRVRRLEDLVHLSFISELLERWQGAEGWG